MGKLRHRHHGWITHLVLAAVGLGACLTAQAGITVLDPVFQAGGDPSDDGPVPSTPGDQTYTADTSVTIMLGGILDVAGGSVLTSGNIVLDAPEGSGLPELIVQGPATRVNLIGNLPRLGLYTQGSVQILDGAVVDATDSTSCDPGTCTVYFGSVQGSDARLLVSGAGSQLNTINDMIAAAANPGLAPLPQSAATIDILAGGAISSGTVVISAGSADPQAPTIAAVDIDGLGSAWNTGSMVVAGGANSIATVMVDNLASVTASESLVIGRGGNASMTVSGGSSLNIAPTIAGSGKLVVGAGSGQGLLVVDKGGTVDIDGELVIAEPDASGLPLTGRLLLNTTGAVTVTGATRIRANGTLTGTGGTLQTDTLEIYSGGVFDTNLLGQVTARETILHPSASLFAFNDIVVGSGIDALTLEQGSNVDANGNDVLIGSGAGSNGTLTMTGAQLQADNGVIQVGTLGGTGTLTASGGSFIGAQNLGVAPRLVIGAGGLVELRDNPTRLSIDGAIQVDGGELRLSSGTQANALTTTITNGGRVTGTGSLASAQVAVGTGGILAPGQSPGLLSITGDLTVQGGSLLFEIGGPNPGDYDVLSVRGNVDLQSGDFKLDLINGFTPDTGAEFRLIDATGSLSVGSGMKFGYVGVGPDYLFQVRDVVDPTGGTFRGGYVTFLATDIAGIDGLTPNQASMARGLDELCPRVEGLKDPTPDEADLDRLCGGLRDSRNTEAQIQEGLDALTPEEITGTIHSLLRLITQQHGNLAQRINGLRYGAKRIDVSGLDLQVDDNRVAGADLQRTFENLIGGAASADEDFSRWGFFGNGVLNRGDKNTTTNESGFDFDGVLLTLGTDYRVRDNLFVGGAFDYNDVTANFDTGGGLDFKSMSLSLFGTWTYQEAGYVDAMATWGTSETDTDRRVHYTDAIGPVDRSANGNADGDQLMASIGAGWDFEKAGFVFGPHTGANLTDVSVDALEEHGASGADMNLPDQQVHSLTANAGFHVSYTFLPSFGVLVPNARIDLVHEFEDDAETVNIRFANDRFADDSVDPTHPIAVRTDALDADYVVWSIGASAQFVNGIAAFVDYRGTALMDDVSLGAVTVGVRMERSF